MGWGLVLSAAAGYAQSRSNRAGMRDQMAMTTEQMELQRQWDKEDEEERRQRMSNALNQWSAYGPGGDRNTMWGEENARPSGFVGGLLAGGGMGGQQPPMPMPGMNRGDRRYG